MKVVLPLAGKGTRLLPLTKYVPKPLLEVAGRTVLDHVLDKLVGLEIDELIVITGHLKEKVEAHFHQHCKLPTRFVEQTVHDGTAGAVNRARPFINGPLLIVYVDTLFEADLTMIDCNDADAIIWTKEVEDYQQYGVVVTDDQGCMSRIVEKPTEPVSRLANIGLYYIRNWQALSTGIDHVLSQEPHSGEWYLTDAFQFMVDQGKRIQTASVQGWYDCGKLSSLLDTNRHLLDGGRARTPDVQTSVRVIPPVRVESGVTLENCTIGPNVSIGSRTVCQSSRLQNVIVGEQAVIKDSIVDDSLLCEGCHLLGQTLSGVVVAGDEISSTT